MRPRIARANVTPEFLKRVLFVDFGTGCLIWKDRPVETFCAGKSQTSDVIAKRWNFTFAGKKAFLRRCKDGYFEGTVMDHKFKAHRVIWAMHYGEWPPELVDHINGNRSDNRMSNLRLANHAENSRNIKSYYGASSKYLGVSWEQSRGKWRASTYFGRKSRIIGRYDCEIEAAKAYDVAAFNEYGDFANPNFPDGLAALEATE